MEGSASQAGFYYQNNVAALKILEALFFNTDISHIHVDNYNKGPHIDDVIVYRSSLTEYNQIKWSGDDDNSYTLFNLLNAGTEKKSIFRQLAEGYIKVSGSGKEFTITLFTTKRESAQKRPSEGIEQGLPEIRTQVFDRVKATNVRYDALANFVTYQNTLEKIRKECGLDADAFNEFIKKLDFKFSQNSVEEIQLATKLRLERLGIDESALPSLLDGVVKWSITGEAITRAIVLKQLGITDRFEDKLSHYFRTVDERFYVINAHLASTLKKTLDELSGGYIFIEGKPGIGKSTALTKFKETNPNTTLAYYCFIPDTQANFGEFRHKANYFLKSLCVAIEKQFPDVDLPMRYSDRFEEKLSAYIDKLGTLDQKIIFIVDGLDHVHRDTTMHGASLLEQIKGVLPPKIFFILSSQYSAVLSPSVAAQVSADQRRHIIVPPFSQPEIDQYLRNKGLKAGEWLAEIERKSQGIPLYLHYISELLLNVQPTEYEQVMASLPALVNGEINSYHEVLYTAVADSEVARWVLAVLAYRKEASTVEDIQAIMKLAGAGLTLPEVIGALKRFSHLLRQKHGRAYTIFHNSFREFILQKTQDLKDAFNSALVAFYEKAPHSDEAYRNYFKHLTDLRQHEKIISATTLSWMKQAWRDLRSLDETKDNLSLALNACVETQSLSEFVRIGFLKAQFDRLSWNLEQSNLDFPLMLLKAGEAANSLRMIWDGDFVLVNKSYFSFYLGEYYSKTGNHLDEIVIRQGLVKSLAEKNQEDLVKVFQAMALVKDDMKMIFTSIDEIKWVHRNQSTADYLTTNFSEEENARVNFGIKQKVIEYLTTHRQFEKLNLLLKEFGEDDKLKLRLQIALVQVLIDVDKASALQLLADIDFSILDDLKYVELFDKCSDYLMEPEIRQVFTHRPLPMPRLHEKVIEERGVSFRLQSDILGLFTALKPLLIFQLNDVNGLRVRASALSAPARNLYASIFLLADLWRTTRLGTPSETDNIRLAQQSLQSLYQPRKKEFRTRAAGLFDTNNDHYFVARSIKHLFSQSFALYARLLSSDGLKILIDYWLQLEQTQDGFVNYTVALTIAEQIHASKRNHPPQLIYKVIQHAEDMIADEGDTDSRTTFFAHVAETYGACGFPDDFRRLYNQLVEMAFGVAYRKDYQASYIIRPLEMYHKTNPAGTLKRLAETLQIQKRLGNAGNARMRHICLSELIAFAAKHYPSLALKLLEKEEKSLGREEAVEIVFTPLIRRAPKEHLPLLLAIIKTLPRWTPKSSDESHFTDLALELLKRALAIHHHEVIGKIIEVIKFNLIVELKEPKGLEKFALALEDAGISPADYGLQLVQKTDISEARERRSERTRDSNYKFMQPVEVPAFDQLLQLFGEGFTKFDDYIEGLYVLRCHNRISSAFRDEYQRSKRTAEAFLSSLPDEVRNNSTRRQAIRNFIEFKNKAANLHPGTQLSFAELEELFDDFIAELAKIFPAETLQDFVETQFDKEAWLEHLLRSTSDRRNHLFSMIIGEETVLKLVREVSVLRENEILLFIRKWTTAKMQSIAILTLANRLLPLDPKKAKALLSEAALSNEQDLIFPRYRDKAALSFDDVQAILRIDGDFGKRFLLQSYLSQQGEYADLFISNLEQLLKYAEHFDDKDIERTFYEANLLYNRELAQGLPEEADDYAFVAAYQPSNDFTTVGMKHLVWLFNYPMVQVRQLALQAVFDLLINGPTHLGAFVQHGILDGDDNQVEHSLTVLTAVSRCHPHLLFPFKAQLLSLAERPHYNIGEMVKELLLYLACVSPGFLTETEKQSVNNLNSRSPIIFTPKPVDRLSGKNFLFSSYQTKLLHRLFDAEKDEVPFPDDLYTDLVAKGWKDWDGEQEGAVHRNYNVNTNFETIEIHSPHYDAVKSSMNRIFHSKVRRGLFAQKDIQRLRRKFRLYDPSNLLYAVQPRPGYINWLSPNATDEGFLDFNDMDELVMQLVHRETDFITLAEYGNQRNEERYGELQATTYFQAFAFLKKKDVELSSFQDDERSLAPLLAETNLYAYEVASGSASSKTYPVNGIKPLLEVSANKFRGQDDLVNANLLPDISGDFGLENKSLLSLLTDGNGQVLQALRWQEPYSSGTRRYKTISAGFALKIKRDVLENYLQKTEMVLCYDVKVERSTDKYKPEEYMEWSEFEEMFEIDSIKHRTVQGE